MSEIEFFEFVDRAASPVRKTGDGYLVADARIARIGVQTYLGDELGKPEMRTVRLYRPEEEVFAADTLASFAHRPMTDNHPPEGKVDAKSWKKYAVGMTDGGVVRDGGFVRVPMMMTDADAIAAYESGKRELSAGYTAIIDWTPGVAPDGTAYDAVQRKIRGNHVALVDKARAGPDCRIGDADRNRRQQQQEDKPMPELRKVIVDGLTIEVTEQGAEAIAKLQKVIADTAAKTETSVKALETALNDAKTAVEKKDGEIAALKGAHAAELKTLGDKLAAAESGIEAKIEERQTVLADAARIAGKAVDGKGKSVADIRKEVVVAKLGDAAKDQGDAYFAAAFDVLASQAKPAAKDALGNLIGDSVAGRNAGDVPVNLGDARAMANTAYAKMVARLGGAVEGNA